MKSQTIPEHARDARRMLRTTFLGRCPACEEGQIFRGVFAMYRECPACGAVLERNEGNFTGAVW